jgi:hypothetical protein
MGCWKEEIRDADEGWDTGAGRDMGALMCAPPLAKPPPARPPPPPPPPNRPLPAASAIHIVKARIPTIANGRIDIFMVVCLSKKLDQV